jgi:RNA polymerase sigma-70 factor, ECF subfamily
MNQWRASGNAPNLRFWTASWDAGAGRSAFTTWFTRIVLNAALMILRKRTNSRVNSLPESFSSGEISWTERIPASQPDPEMVCAEG